MDYISNVFSFNMILNKDVQKGTVNFEVIDKNDIPEDAVSIIHYGPAAKVIGSELGREIVGEKGKRFTITADDVLYLAKIEGGNLTQNDTVLPEGYGITYIKVTVA